MSLPRKIGTYPTPYGVSVDVYEGDDPIHPQAVTFEAIALLGGIHSTAQRAAFAFRCNEGSKVDLELILEHGGDVVPRITLEAPAEPIYPSLPRNAGSPTEALVRLMKDRQRWSDRVDALLPQIDANLGCIAEGQPDLLILMSLAIALLVTASLEELDEVEIGCIEAAAIYALSEHRQWSAAGVRWLTPFKDTWAGDWITARPAYRRWASARISDGSKLPAWLARGRIQ